MDKALLTLNTPGHASVKVYTYMYVCKSTVDLNVYLL